MKIWLLFHYDFSHEIHCSKYFKEQKIFPKTLLHHVPRSTAHNLDRSGLEFPILLQHFKGRSKFETTEFQFNWCPAHFDGSNSAIRMFLNWSIFIFWKPKTSHKHGLKRDYFKRVILKDSQFHRREWWFDSDWNFKLFTRFIRNYFFYTKTSHFTKFCP